MKAITIEASGVALSLNGIKSSFISTALSANILIEMQVYILVLLMQIKMLLQMFILF